ncbi:phage Gp37/Gp68 family protein [Methylobacterium iners]|uniref:phage Gp37/Gp68 family protein n=1 Tax=Methylobacterium iners TaxID=418707 RepID=UPI001EE2864B|nr:phage Gp37/Gp68 family protein [Methylobacterium iners]
MAETSTIEWTDATWNPITGCAVISPGCTNCYAMGLAGTRLKNHPSRAGLTLDTAAGPVWNGQVRLNEEWLLQPLQWRRPRLIFVCAHGDLFAPGVPDAWIDRVFAVMALADWHTFQVLTKRSARMREYLTHPLVKARIAMAMAKITAKSSLAEMERGRQIVVQMESPEGWPLPNVWKGVSAEDQRRADQRIPDLLATPAAVRYVSAEPLLGPIDFRAVLKMLGGGTLEVDALTGIETMTPVKPDPCRGSRLDWIIVGGESGPGARPMHPAWARAIRDQCEAARVAFHFKQYGAWAPEMRGPDWMILDREGGLDVPDDRYPDEAEGEIAVTRVGKKAAGRLLDGVEHNGMPEVRHV